MKINFVGDLIFGDQPVKFGFGFDSLHHKSKYKNVFQNVENTFSQADFNVANFESIIKDRPLKPTVSNWSMCCDNNVIEAMLQANINVVSVANNHSMDYGLDSFNSTVSSLEAANIKVIGKKNHPYAILSSDDLKLAIIGVSYLKVKTLDVPYFYNPTNEEWSNLIERLKIQSVNKIVIYVHWGNEFVDHPSEKQLEILNDLSNLGIDAIIGHHPHVLQPAYVFKSIPVFFSLGNFVSDYWQKRARISTILNLNLGKDERLNWRTTSCYLDEEGCPTITQGKMDVEFKSEIISSNIEDVNASRKRLRVEYLNMLSKNFYKIKNKRLFLNWLYRRFVFIVKYGKEEKINPDIIYEKYKH